MKPEIYTLLTVEVPNMMGHCPFECERYPEGFTFVMDVVISVYEEEMEDMLVSPKGGRNASVWIFDGDTEDFLEADEFWKLVDVSVWKLADCLMHFDMDKVKQEFHNSILAREYKEERVEISPYGEISTTKINRD